MTSIKDSLATLGIHEHYHVPTSTLSLVLTEVGEPAPSQTTEITLQHHIFVLGRLTEETVEIIEDDGELSVFYHQDHPSLRQLASFIEDRIIERQ